MSRVVTVDCTSLSGAKDRAAELANSLADLARKRDDAQLARLATDAMGLTTDLQGTSELLAEIAGVLGGGHPHGQGPVEFPL
jgi:hypothetical protein